MSIDFVGPEGIFDRPKAAILNSRQSKYPLGSDDWVSTTVEAVSHLVEHGYALVTSLGMNTWELALASAARLDMKVIIIVLGSDADRLRFIDDIYRRFHLNPARTGFGFMAGPTGRTPKESWPARDAAVVETADRLFPVSIRPAGTMAALVEANRPKVDSTFAIPYKDESRPRPRYDLAVLNPAIDWEQWLIHFTRSSSGPWPDESDFDFHHAIITSTDEFCRSARRTLPHIIETGIVYSSAKKIRGGFGVVPFGLVTPATVTHLFRYRPRFLNPGFEPYGLAISKEAAVTMGIRPVIYGLPDTYDSLSDDDKPFFQNRGSHEAQWTIENEWRHLGDFRLDRIPPDHLRVIVPFLHEFQAPRNRPLPPAIALFHI